MLDHTVNPLKERKPICPKVGMHNDGLELTNICFINDIDVN